MSDPQRNVTDLPIEFYNEINDDPALFDEVSRRLNKLSQGHTDVTRATVTLRRTDNARATETDASVMLEVRPDNVYATGRHWQPVGALKAALDAAERQVRDKREKLRNY